MMACQKVHLLSLKEQFSLILKSVEMILELIKREREPGDFNF